MKLRLFAVFLLFIFLVSGASAYQIVGNSVVFEDSYAKLTVTPHTASNPFWTFQQEFEVENKTASAADLYIAYAFPRKLNSGKAELWNGSQWIDVTSNINYYKWDANSMHIYYSTTPINFGAGEIKKWRITYKPQSNTGKWDLIAWTGASWNCILNGTCQKVWQIDPWWSANYEKRKQITVTNNDSSNALDTNTLVTFNFNTTSTNLQDTTDCNDMRVVSEVSGTEVEVFRSINKCNDSNTTVGFVLDQNIAASGTDDNYWVYYSYASPGSYNLEPTHIYEDFYAGNKTGGTFNWTPCIGADVNADQLMGIQSGSPYGCFITADGVDGNLMTPWLQDINARVTYRARTMGADRHYWHIGIDGHSNSENNDFQIAQSETSGNQNLILKKGGVSDTTTIVGANQTDAMQTRTAIKNNNDFALYTDTTLVDADVVNLSVYWGGSSFDRIQLRQYHASNYSMIDDIKVYPGINPIGTAEPTVSLGVETGQILAANFTYSAAGATDHNIIYDFNDTSEDYNADYTIDTWSWDVNGVEFSTNQDTNRSLSVGDFNICLDVNSHDNGNNHFDQHCEVVSVTGGHVRMQFVDENTAATLTTASATFNSTTYDANADGFIFIDLSDIDLGTYILSASDSTHSARTFVFDLNFISRFDLNVALLQTTKGRNTGFQFYGTDETTLLGDANVSVKNLTIDKYVHYNNKADGSGKATFFINPEDANYQFEIVDNTGTYTYKTAILAIKQPKDEESKAVISDYNLAISGLKQESYDLVSADKNLYIYANTQSYYTVTVGATDYYERKFDIQLKGDTNIYELQPFLAATVDSVSTTISTISSYDLTPIANVEVRIYKYLADEGRVLVETVTTDYKGEAFISGITNDTYEFEVYYNDELIYEPDITVTSTTITIMFNPLAEVVYDIPAQPSVFFDPHGGKLRPGVSNLQQVVSIEYGTITSIRIYVIEWGDTGNILRELYDENFTTGIETGYTNTITTASLVTAGWDFNNNIEISVSIGLSDGNKFDSNTTYYGYSGERVQDVGWQMLTVGIKTEVGCEADGECGILIWIAVLLSAVGTGAIIASTPLRDPIGGIIIAFAFLGFFVFIGWVPIFYYAIGFLGGLAGIAALVKVM